MFQQQWPARTESVYQADEHWCDQVRAARQQLSHICEQCKNRPVRVQTIDGYTYEGTVAGVSNGCLHLVVQDNRFFGPYAANSILTLVLYELLVITLMI